MDRVKPLFTPGAEELLPNTPPARYAASMKRKAIDLSYGI
jgi:hypothetical protein